AAVQAQGVPQPGPNGPTPVPTEVLPPTVTPEPSVPPEPSRRAGGLEGESLPAELAEDVAAAAPAAPKLGPTPVADVRFLMETLGLEELFGDSGIRTFGWIEAGYTGASTSQGLLSVQPRQNRFGDELLFNQLGLVLQKPLQQDQFDIGFNIRYFAGA